MDSGVLSSLCQQLGVGSQLVKSDKENDKQMAHALTTEHLTTSLIQFSSGGTPGAERLVDAKSLAGGEGNSTGGGVRGFEELGVF